MKNSEILIAAKANIDAPEKWCQAEWALDDRGKPVAPGDVDAVCFCAISSFSKLEMRLQETAVAKRFLRDSINKLHNIPSMTLAIAWAIVAFNDQHTHDEVMQAFDHAIVAAKAQEAKELETA
jgi:hypothetical protein